MKLFKDVKAAVTSIEDKKSLLFFALTYFLVTLTYSLFRTGATAMFIHQYGASQTPLISVATVAALTLSVLFGNALQKRFCVQTAFTVLALVSSLIFMLALIGAQHGISLCYPLLYIWKETYIVFMVHLPWGYANNLLKEKQAEVVFGLASTGGSLGGIVGGLFCTPLARAYGVPSTIIAGSLILGVTALVFSLTQRLEPSRATAAEKAAKPSPIRSLKGAESYVMLICGIIALTQVFITILDLKFNLFVEASFPDLTAKNSFLGNAFALINTVTLTVKIVALPVIFLLIKNRKIQTLIPIVYLLVLLPSVALPQMAWLVAMTFITVKGLDYSLFNVSKEILYYPLTATQKYGAKYLGDIFGYRAAKAGISFVLIFYQQNSVLNALLIGALIVWLVATFFIQRTIPRAIPEPEKELSSTGLQPEPLLRET